jgi:hypothetical protein
MVTKNGGAHRAALGALAAILALALISPASAVDRRVRVVNDSTRNIVRLLAANVDEPRELENMLGDDILPKGGSVVLNFEDGSGYCRYLLRALFDDGLVLVRESVNVCEVGTYRYTD